MHCCFLRDTFPLGITPNSQKNIESDKEDSTLLKIATCIPALGLVIAQIESKSLNHKFTQLSLPRKLRSDPELGNILGENASKEQIKNACERAIQLKSIERDYNKATLVNNLLTIALAIYALAINVLPFFIGAFLIGGFSLTAAVFSFVLYMDSFRPTLQKVLREYIN